ncbi:MAG: thiol:disulfide interchange protein DsbA/DsbL [Pseudomonadota bacterium]|jgi:thiol:disulfide interchange protein DsbA|nr:thiol:disulfide interchange protein DsbA/DsbL [Pseudomonadota bacterium]MEC8108636.1 thiol:disulfide interchange protein DsbA/DsbL [Pseudomonadota bacterium]GIR10880.1 MAG: thiol:disulfide interchange protein DsbA [Gammaproteobacteria bacterium]|tara:strand:- start:403 stop:1026 length:624 start_codon:yes stop_codon:yes gene_type:complete
MFQDCIKNALIVLVLSLFCSSAFSKDYQEGRHYELIEPLPTRNPEKIEVIEFFWFGCGHCFSLEQLIKDWKSEVSSEVDFFRLPVVWNAQTKTHAKLFFATETLQVPEAIQGIFSAIHYNRKMMLSDKEIIPFFQGYGIQEDKYLAATNSFGLKNNLRKAELFAFKYGIKGVPAFIVNGKYKVSATREIGTEDLLDVVNYLIEKEQS